MKLTRVPHLINLLGDTMVNVAGLTKRQLSN